VRFNRDGKLFVPHGYVAALNPDPTEKKPFFHILPGSTTLTFGMLGCDLHCANCQNWEISQVMRDADADGTPTMTSPEQIVAIAKRTGSQLIGSSYNEPLITSEWSVEIFKQAKAQGIRGLFVSNGNATRETLEFIRPYVVGYKIDLKTMQDKQYRQLGTPLNTILDSIKLVEEMGFWLEIVTLIIPGFNDSSDELMDAARYIRSVSPNIPWHVTAFHPDYKMTDADYTPASTLLRAAEIGQEAGLNFVYAGNLPGSVKNYENTYCPKCNTPLVERFQYRIIRNRMKDTNACPKCGETIPGIWK
jgi:pyruvate formate lyase activating enzyme